MATCHFCRRTFTNAQGVRAHLKSCPAYQHKPPSLAAPRRNQRLEDQRHIERLFGRASTPSPRASTPEVREPAKSVIRPLSRPPANPMAEVLRQQQQAHQEAQRQAQADQQQRATRMRAILQQIKFLIVDLHIPRPPVPPAAIAEAKLAIERELIKLPLLELPLMELQQIGAAIRDKVYAGYQTAIVPVPIPTTSLITPTPSPLPPQEVAMPMHRLLSGDFACPRCDQEFALDRVQERDAVCQDCRVPLEELEEDEDDEH